MNLERPIRAAEIANIGGIMLAQHSDSHPRQRLTTYLEGQNAPKEKIARVFSTDGSLILPIRADVSVYTLAPEDLDVLVRSTLNPLYELVNVSLNGSTLKFGHAAHDQDMHIDTVVSRGDALLRASNNYGLDVRRRFILAARGHDLGNLPSRRYHAHISELLLSHFFPQVLTEPDQWEKISHAIIFHDEPIIKEFLDSQEGASLNDKIEIMQMFFSPEALALLIADKTDKGRRRIGSASNLPGGMEDGHVSINMLGQTDEQFPQISEDGNTFIWKINFDPKVTVEEATFYDKLVKPSKNGGHRLYVSEEAHTLYREHAVSYFNSWRKNLFEIHFDRVQLAVMAVFALFPDMKQFKLEMIDKHDSGATIDGSITFERAQLDRQFAEVQKLFLPKEPKT